jgi:hypothetical protein
MAITQSPIRVSSDLPHRAAGSRVGLSTLSRAREQGEICLLVAADDGRLERRVVGQEHRDLVGLGDHVMVGHDVAGRVDDEARAERVLLTALRPIAAVALEELAEELLEFLRAAALLDRLGGRDVDHRGQQFVDQIGEAVRGPSRLRRRGQDQGGQDQGQSDEPADHRGITAKADRHLRHVMNSKIGTAARARRAVDPRNVTCDQFGGPNVNFQERLARTGERRPDETAGNDRRSSAQQPDEEHAEARRDHAGDAQDLGRHLGHAFQDPAQAVGKERKKQPLDHQDQGEAGQQVGHGAPRSRQGPGTRRGGGQLVFPPGPLSMAPKKSKNSLSGERTI